MPATVRDVAALAGVSPATVSRALHGNSAISEATRRRVEQAAAKLGYANTRPPVDRARVAVVMPFLDRWYFAQVLDGIERTLADRGFLIIIHRLLDLDGRRRALLGAVLRRQADGVVLVNVPPAPDEAAFLRERRIPLVLLGAALPGVPSVRIDDEAAARSATSHLLALGHRRIALVSGRPYERIPFTAAPDRTRGFLHSLKEAGVAWDPTLEVNADFTARGAQNAFPILLDRADRPTAVFAESDEMAFGVMAAARAHGLRIPEDLSVVGLDDHELAESMGLSTVAQPVHTLGELAALHLAGLITEQVVPQTPTTVVVPTMLVPRASTAVPPGARPRLRRSRVRTP